jgi:response regulator RpfG family c-di-GMP phosphodiesterase
MNSKILFVDDEPNVLDAYQRSLRKRFSIDTALSGDLALTLLSQKGPYAVIVADMQMPGMNGVELLTHARQRSPDSVRLMLTGNADQKTAVEAVNKGHVYQFLNKPCPPEMLILALDNSIRQYQLITAERELLEQTLNGSINMMTGILASAEPLSFGRGERLRDYMRAFTRSLDMTQTWELELAAMLSQIGFVTVPQRVVEKMRRDAELTQAERDVLSRTPEIGANLLANIPRLETVARIVLYQNKNYNGSGFPADSIVGDEIPIGSRILKVLSEMMELESTGLTKAKALEQMQTRTGRYDPQVLDSTFACFDVYLAAPTAVKVAIKAIPLKDLSIGHILSSNVETKDGVLIVCAGTKVSQMALEKLRNFDQIQGIKEPIHVQTQEF